MLKTVAAAALIAAGAIAVMPGAGAQQNLDISGIANAIGRVIRGDKNPEDATAQGSATAPADSAATDA